MVCHFRGSTFLTLSVVMLLAPLQASMAQQQGTPQPSATLALRAGLRLTLPEKPDRNPAWLMSSVRIGKVSVPASSLGLVGASAAAAGAGGFFGLQSRARLQAARDASFRDELVARHGEAVKSARTANVLFGAAAVLATGGFVTWALSRTDESAHGGVK